MDRKIKTRLGGHTASNLAFPAGGIRRPHPRLDIGGRGCGNAWSLGDISCPEKFQESSILVRKMKTLNDTNGRLCAILTPRTPLRGLWIHYVYG